MHRTGLASRGKLFIVQIDRDDGSPAKRRSCNHTQTDTSASKHRYGLACRHTPASRRVKSHRKRLNQAKFLQGEIRAVKLRCRHGDPLHKSTVALHSKRLVKLAGIWAIAQTRGAT